MLRRTFLAAGAGAAARSLAAAAGTPDGIPLGFDSYSLRAWGWKAPQLLDYAASLKLDSVQISSLGEYESLDATYLAGIKDRAKKANIVIDAGIGSICPTSKSWNPKNGTPAEYLASGLKAAQAVGAKSMRVFMGSSEDRRGPVPIEKHMEETVRALRSARALAMDSGVKIGLENHNGDLLSREVEQIILSAGKEFVGSCLDTGNPMWALEDPLLTLEILGPYAVTTHIRDSVVFEHPRGAAWQWVALGDGVVDFKRFVARFREVCPKGTTMQLENITGRPPRVVPYLEPEFWTQFPKMRASDFATFVSLAKRGHPLMETMVIEDYGSKRPAEYDAALKTQQRRDLEKSLDYAKRVLGAGINWRS